MRERQAGFVVACLLVMGLAGSLAAAPTPEQRREIGELGTLLTKAGNLYKEAITHLPQYLWSARMQELDETLNAK